jgi:branched-chain amino acid transport system substrate-binding protein
MRKTKRWWWLGAASALVLVWAAPARAEGEQFMPVPSYRVGPYAAGGTSLYGGFIDYMNLINMRDGGINGVKLTWEECETEYKPDRGVECYERLKARAPRRVDVPPYSTGISYALISKVSQDKIPLVTIAHGRTDAADGRYFPYVFPLITHYWSQNTDIIRYIGQREGGMAKLKGKKIVHLHHGSAYGKEPNVVFQKQAEKYGYEAKIIEVPAPGSEQQAQWLEIRQFKPDWVIVTGWGVMNPAMLKNARGWASRWTTSSGTSGPARRKTWSRWARRRRATSARRSTPREGLQGHPGDRAGGVRRRQGQHGRQEAGGEHLLQSRGPHRIVSVEAIRVAQGKFGKKPLTGEQIRWGLENLNLDPARIAAIGATNFIQPLKVTCSDHEGGGAVKFQQWDGTKWKVISDWVQADKELVRPLIEESASKYAKENNIPQRDCAKEST